MRESGCAAFDFPEIVIPNAKALLAQEFCGGVMLQAKITIRKQKKLDCLVGERSFAEDLWSCLLNELAQRLTVKLDQPIRREGIGRLELLEFLTRELLVRAE